MIEDILKAHPLATDIHVTEGAPVVVREKGLLVTVERDLAPVIEEIQTTQEKDGKGHSDWSCAVGSYRLRCHAYEAQGQKAYALRILPSLSDLPPDRDEGWVKEMAGLSSGLVLVSGPAGSGKSTTLAHIISTMNEHRPCHIITLEDPVEYVYPKKKALIHQRTIGQDTAGFAVAVKEALREDPDVIVIGEMRDAATMEAALSAAETGHLVLATVHNRSVKEAIGRIVHAFSAEKQSEVRRVLSYVLQSVAAQRLWRKGEKTVLFREILTATPAVSRLIREGEETQLSTYMESGNRHMRTFRKAIEGHHELTEEERREIASFLMD